MSHRMSVPIKICCFALAFLMIAWTLFVVLDSLVLESVSTEKPIVGPTVSRDTSVSKSPVSVDWGIEDSSVYSGESSGEETDEPDPDSSGGETSGTDDSKTETSKENSKENGSSTSKDSSKNTSKENTSKSASTIPGASWSLPAGTSQVIRQYRDDDIAIQIKQYREYNSDIYVAEIVLSSVDYLKTALAKGTYGRHIRALPSKTAQEANAILAINGDYYGARESGYVIRNGVLYRQDVRDNRRCLAVYDDGRFEIVAEEKVSALELLNNHAVQVLSFGPSLIENGVITAGDHSEIMDTTVPHNNPRTVMAMIDPLHYIFCVVDGRTDVSKGMKLADLAAFLKGLGCTEAYNLDGGGTSWMYFQGEVINHPSDGHYYGERSVSDIVCITKG